MSPFPYCPSCLSPSPVFENDKRLHCKKCGFEFFQNTAAAVGALIRGGNRFLLIRRAREPGYGLLDIPGGFVDPGETLEEALKRECLEEIGEAPESVSYFCSQSNRYEYAGISYTTADAFFFAEFKEPLRSDEDLLRLKVDSSEVLSVHLIDIQNINPDDLAFPSLKKVFLKLQLSA